MLQKERLGASMSYLVEIQTILRSVTERLPKGKSENF